MAENIGSEKVMIKCGLIKEAEHLDWEWHDGKMKTRLEYRLLKHEWQGAIKHYIEEHGSVPLWVLVNYLTIGNLSYLYSALKDAEKNTIAKYYSDKYVKQYKPASTLRISSEDMESALKIFNLVINQCAHDERLFNSDYKNIRVANIANYFGITNYNNRRIVVAILYFKVVLNKSYYKKFHSELHEIFERYKNEFQTVRFDDILNIMGVDLLELEKLK